MESLANGQYTITTTMSNADKQIFRPNVQIWIFVAPHIVPSKFDQVAGAAPTRRPCNSADSLDWRKISRIFSISVGSKAHRCVSHLTDVAQATGGMRTLWCDGFSLFEINGQLCRCLLRVGRTCFKRLRSGPEGWYGLCRWIFGQK